MSTRGNTLAQLIARPFAIMGVVNVTPDSFYDGGRHGTVDTALEHARRLVAEGADILDIGGESSRPGAQPVDVGEELSRVVPLIERLRAETDVAVSVDTTKAAVAEAAVTAGADWINDISAGRFDPAMAPLAGRLRCPVVLMHSRGTPATMQRAPSYGDVVEEVCVELAERVALFAGNGVAEGNIILDPGIGFAKRFEDNIELLRGLDRLVAMGHPVLVGTSRKSFVGKIAGKEADGRLWGSLGSVAAAWTRGARMFRVHDVAETGDMLKVIAAIELA